MDVPKQETQVCIEDTNGAVILEQRIRTTRERFTALLGGRPRARILLEAATESEWVAQHLETLGHEVIVADPNYAAMYATRSRRVKTDRRDARTLADACRLGAYHPAHRTSPAQREVRAGSHRARGAGPDAHPLPLGPSGRCCAARRSGCQAQRGRVSPAPPAGGGATGPGRGDG